VTAILATLDSRTRRVPVVAEFDNAAKGPGGAAPLRAGAFVRAWVGTSKEVPVLRLPHAVLRPGTRDELFAVNPATSALEARQIVYAISPDGTLLVRQGVGRDDQLVLSPIAEAKGGDVVRVDGGAEGAAAEAAPAAEAPKAGTP